MKRLIAKGILSIVFFINVNIARSELAPVNTSWPRVWTTYRTVKSIDEDFADLKAHSINAVMLGGFNQNPTVEQARKYLNVARQYDIKLGIRLGNHLLPNAEMVEEAGLEPEYGIMIGGVYQGKAIDRFLFRFSPQPHNIIIEPPVYNQKFAYTGRVSGQRIAHYYPEIGDPVKAEIVVPLAPFDGKQHIKIIKPAIEKVTGPIKLSNDSVSEDMVESYETQERMLYRLSFDLTGLQEALLDQVGIAVYWKYHGSKEWYILNWAPVSMAAPSTAQAVKAKVRKQLGIWTRANGGEFPQNELIALRFGDEPFYLTGHLRERTPSVNYPLWDYSASSAKRYLTLTDDKFTYPRTWGYPDIYGKEAYSLWMYSLHQSCAEICEVARREAKTFSRDLMVFRNTSRSGVFSLNNDHDGSGPELLTQHLDLVHIDPYPVGSSGYGNNIPRDMSYYGGLARRYGKTLFPWMQAHSYIGLEHVSPEDIEHMTQEQWEQGVDAIMWLGYSKGATFPLIRPESWEKAGQFHEKINRRLPPKPKAKLAVIRSYDAWAFSNMKVGVIQNPYDWLLQQWLEVWAVKHGKPYDVFELPPGLIHEAQDTRDKILQNYSFIISNIPVEGAWFIGKDINEEELPLASSTQYREQFEREMKSRGWLSDPDAASEKIEKLTTYYFGNSFTGNTMPGLHPLLGKSAGKQWKVKASISPGVPIWFHMKKQMDKGRDDEVFQHAGRDTDALVMLIFAGEGLSSEMAGKGAIRPTNRYRRYCRLRVPYTGVPQTQSTRPRLHLHGLAGNPGRQESA